MTAAYRWILVEIVTTLLIILFVYTAADKLVYHHRFEKALAKYNLIGDIHVLLSWTIPLLELFVSTLLIFPSTRRSGLIASFILLALFTCYLAYMIAFAPELPCSCGGVISSLNWREHLLFNSAFLLITGAGIVATKSTKEFIAINRHSRKPV